MIAETWLGAFACADGNQIWQGKNPAFMPNPKRASQKSGGGTSRAGPRSQLPVCEASRAKKAKSASVPAWEAARYSQPAFRTSGRRLSSVIRKNPQSANASHAIRKSSPLDIINTRPMHNASAFHQIRPRAAEAGYSLSGQ